MTKDERIELLERRVNELYGAVSRLIDIEAERSGADKVPILRSGSISRPSTQ